MKHKRPIPPKRAEQFLQWFLRDELVEEVLGDLEEKFFSVAESKSPVRAKLNYWYQVLNYLRPFAIKNAIDIPFTYTAMYKHNFLVSRRMLMRNKAYSLINIGGLALGMTVVMLLSFWVWG